MGKRRFFVVFSFNTPDFGTIPVDFALWHEHASKWLHVTDVEAVANQNTNSTMHEVKKTAPLQSINSADYSITVDPTTECCPPALPLQVSYQMELLLCRTASTGNRSSTIHTLHSSKN